MTIAVAGNSLEALDLKVQKEDEEDREDSVPYFKWATSEWVYEGWRRDLFKNACKELREDSERTDISTFSGALFCHGTSFKFVARDRLLSELLGDRTYFVY